MYALYTFLYTLGLASMVPRALRDVARGGPRALALRERLGSSPAVPAPARGGIWIHAVSVGEVHAARGLIPHLRRELPGLPVLLSTTTATGQQLAGGAGADATFYLPLDLPGPLRRTFALLRPRWLLLVETELWPNLMRAARLRGVPVALVNGRLSARSLARYRRLRRWWPGLLEDLRVVCARTPAEADRFRRLGIPARRVFAAGNLKADAMALQPPEQLRRRLARALAVDPRRPLIVAGCTMRGEEERVLEAFRRLLRGHPRARLLIAPRHPERFDEVEQLARTAGFAVRRRSGSGPADAPVLLLDTIGELPAAYGLGTVSFVGGSLVPTGGHNLLEPAIQAQPLLFGPCMDNFATLAEQFVRHGAARQVADAETLATSLAELLEDGESRRLLGARARALALADAAAGARTARILHRELGG